MKPGKIDLFKWLRMVPKIAALVDRIHDAAKDGNLSADEIREIGRRLVAIVAEAV